ncbi:MAG: hypothetical protein WAL98_18365 [Desulfatiglandaceae bacterium]|jgi:predicted DNA-binding protein
MEANSMRTTIEISAEHRGALLSLAAKKGLRGYSTIIEEALDLYIEHQGRASGIKSNVLRMKGSWKKEETEKTKSSIAELRENWKQL